MILRARAVLTNSESRTLRVTGRYIWVWPSNSWQRMILPEPALLTNSGLNWLLLAGHFMSAWLSSSWQNDSAGARATYELGIKKTPGDGQVYRGLAQLQLAENDFAGARSTYELGIKNAPVDGQVYLGLAQLQLAENDSAGARATYELGITKCLSWGAFMSAWPSSSWQKMTRPERALLMNSEVKKTPADGQVYAGLAQLQLAENDLRERAVLTNSASRMLRVTDTLIWVWPSNSWRRMILPEPARLTNSEFQNARPGANYMSHWLSYSWQRMILPERALLTNSESRTLRLTDRSMSAWLSYN